MLGSGETMSLRGRLWMDRFQHRLQSWSSRFRLPTPPYEDSRYWEHVYKKLPDETVFEWGNLTYRNDLHSYPYKPIKTSEIMKGEESSSSSSLIEMLKLNKNHQKTKFRNSEEDVQKTLLLLGCGNSNLGLDLLQAFNDQKNEHDEYNDDGATVNIVQCDISPHIVATMSRRYEGIDQMKIIQDDAAQLTAFSDEECHAILDKGLMDALHLASHSHPSISDTHTDASPAILPTMLSTINRVLKPGGAFVTLTYSHPDYFLPHFDQQLNNGNNKWSTFTIQELDTIYLYQFIKSSKSYQSTYVNNNNQQLKKSPIKKYSRRTKKTQKK